MLTIIWKWSTGISLLQAVVFAAVQGLDADITLVSFTATFAFVFVFATVAFAFAGSFAGAFTSALAFTASAFTTFALVTSAFVFTGATFAVVVVAFTTAFFSVDEAKGEPCWALSLAALPLGVGTVLGGAVLLYRYFRAWHSVGAK